MKSVVAAASAHLFVVEVTVAIELAPKLLSDVSSMLDRSGLLRGEHWSLSAEYDKNIRLCFALSSRVFANLLRSAINIFVRPDHSATTSTPIPLEFRTHGKASGTFQHCIKVHVAAKPEIAPPPQPVIETPCEFQNVRDDVFHWG